MLTVTIQKVDIRIGSYLAVSFHRTLRIPDDGRVYPLPPGLGTFPLFRVEDYRARLPESWRAEDGAFISMYQREALWLGFHGPEWHAQAVKVAVGGINALSGHPDNPALSADPQDYIVCPDQPWLDGINTGRGSVRQFVAMPLGEGYTVEAVLSGREDIGGIQLTGFESCPGKFPDRAPPAGKTPLDTGPGGRPRPMAVPVMGLGAGGCMRQKIYPDPYGIDTWNSSNRARVSIHILNSCQFTAVTGQAPPPSPIDVKTYTEHGLPWFVRYDEERVDIAPSERLGAVKSIGAHDAETGGTAAQVPSVEIADTQIRTIGGTEN
ncbi:MAG: hypothetical protein JJV98_14325 [Desulfosarcina sp.]|nr:hypothetical protein [Desulfobacterales bacterium]